MPSIPMKYYDFEPLIFGFFQIVMVIQLGRSIVSYQFVQISRFEFSLPCAAYAYESI